MPPASKATWHVLLSSLLPLAVHTSKPSPTSPKCSPSHPPLKFLPPLRIFVPPPHPRRHLLYTLSTLNFRLHDLVHFKLMAITPPPSTPPHQLLLDKKERKEAKKKKIKEWIERLSDATKALQKFLFLHIFPPPKYFSCILRISTATPMAIILHSNQRHFIVDSPPPATAVF